MGIWVQGPLCGKLLSDLGATVTKLEAPGFGDPTRHLRTLYGVSTAGAGGGNALFEFLNGGKRSVVVDLKSQQGPRIIERLLTKADVFVSNMQPSSLQALGVGQDVAVSSNPNIIYAIGAGLGSRASELQDKAAQDTVAMAYSGFMQTVSRGAGVPSYPPGAIADVLGGTFLAFSVLSELAARGRSTDRDRRRVGTSLLRSMLWMQSIAVCLESAAGTPLESSDRASVTNPLMNTYRCSDGEWVALGLATLGERNWALLLRAIGDRPWTQGGEFGSSDARSQNRVALIARLEETFCEQPLAEWVRVLGEHGIPCGPVHSLSDLLASDVLDREEAIVRQGDGSAAFVTGPIDGMERSIGDAPELGEHTAEVLKSLGYTAAEIEDLVESRVVWCGS